MNRRTIIILIILGIAVYAGIHLFGGKEAEPEKAQAEALALRVSVVSPTQGTLDETLSVTGNLVPAEEITVLTELSGVRVKALYADVGERVKKGQKLALLDAESLIFQANQLEAEYARARDEYARMEAIKNSGAVSKLSVTEKFTATQAAKARLDDAQLAVKRATIIASDDGVIYERRATLGALVNASEPLFRIAQNGEIEAELRVPEASLGKLTRSQSISLNIAGKQDLVHGTIRLITPQIDAATRTGVVRVKLKDAPKLIAGSFVRGEIALSQSEGLILPATAILEDNTGPYVWVVDASDKAVRTPVSISARHDSQMIVDGVEPSARVIAKAGAFVKEGDNVHPMEAK
jgi:HlyD family secretion protein